MVVIVRKQLIGCTQLPVFQHFFEIKTFHLILSYFLKKTETYASGCLENHEERLIEKIGTFNFGNKV